MEKDIYKIRRSFLRGYRTFIGFIIGTLLVILCLYYSRNNPDHFVPILSVWTGIYGVFVSKNYIQTKNNDKEEYMRYEKEHLD